VEGVRDQFSVGDALAQADGIRRREFTSVELVGEMVERIERFDQLLRAHVTVDPEAAFRAAQLADQYLQCADPETIPPLHGIPTSIKDVIDVAAMPTTHSSKALAENTAQGDDPLVDRMC
jgi:amidase